MIKLQNIANSIIYEQQIPGETAGFKYDTNPGWLVKVREDIRYMDGKKTLKQSENPAHMKDWEVTEFAKEFKRNGDFTDNIRNIDDAIKFINSFEDFRVYPDVYNKNVLLRDENKSVYLVNYPDKGFRTHWTDVNFETGIDKDTIWKDSKYIGDGNADWFEKVFPLSKKSKQTRNPRVTKNDQLTAKLVVAAYSSWGGGTNEKWLKQAIEDIKTMDQYDIINKALTSIYTVYQSSTAFADEMIFIRTSKSTKVYKLPWTRSAKKLGSNLAWKIWGTIGSGWQPHYNSMVVHAVLPDFIVANASDTDNGIRGVIEGETSGELLDELLTILIKNGICTYDPETISAVFPDDTKVNLNYLPPDEILDNDDYLYDEPEEEAPEEEAPEKE